MAHEQHCTERHNWKQFEELRLITFFAKLEFVLHAPSTNKGITNIWIIYIKKKSAIFQVNSHKYGIHT